MENDMIQLEIDAATLEINGMQSLLNAKIAYRDGLKFALNGAGKIPIPLKDTVRGQLLHGPIVHRRPMKRKYAKKVYPPSYVSRMAMVLRNAGKPMHVRDIAKALGSTNLTSIYMAPTVFRSLGKGMFTLVDKGEAKPLE